MQVAQAELVQESNVLCSSLSALNFPERTTSAYETLFAHMEPVVSSLPQPTSWLSDPMRIRWLDAGDEPAASCLLDVCGYTDHHACDRPTIPDLPRTSVNSDVRWS